MSETPKDTPVAGEDILAAADAWRQEGEAVALATVVETWGSSPARPAPASRSAAPAASPVPCPAAASRVRWPRWRRR